MMIHYMTALLSLPFPSLSSFPISSSPSPSLCLSPSFLLSLPFLVPQSNRVNCSIISDRATLEREYPCLAAVDRAARAIDRHAARVIWLEYEGEGEVEETLFIVGKG